VKINIDLVFEKGPSYNNETIITIFDWQNVGGWEEQQLQWVVQNLSF